MIIRTETKSIQLNLAKKSKSIQPHLIQDLSLRSPGSGRFSPSSSLQFLFPLSKSHDLTVRVASSASLLNLGAKYKTDLAEPYLVSPPLHRRQAPPPHCSSPRAHTRPVRSGRSGCSPRCLCSPEHKRHIRSLLGGLWTFA